MLRNFVWYILLLSALPAAAQLYTPAALKADLRFVKKQLESTHPALYRYTPKKTFAAFFDSLDNPRPKKYLRSSQEFCIN